MMLSNGFIKLSIVAFYRRIFVTSKNSVFDIVTKILALVIFLWTITFILIDIFACGGHVTASWGSLDEQSKYCDTIGYTSEEGFAVSDLIIDIFVIASPLPLVSCTAPINRYAISDSRQVWKRRCSLVNYPLIYVILGVMRHVPGAVYSSGLSRDSVFEPEK